MRNPVEMNLKDLVDEYAGSASNAGLELGRLLMDLRSYRQDALRYRALRDSGRYAPDPFGNGWALSMNHGTPTDELDAAADEIRPK